MNISENGIHLITSFEGCRLTAYTDAAGVLTIGYGHTKGVKAGQLITQEQAYQYLKEDLKTAEKYVTKHSAKYNFNQNQFDALVSFTFNCGASNLTKLTGSDKRSIAEISDHITSYNKAGGKVLNGLVRRRAAEKALFDKPCESEYYPAYTGHSQNIDAILKEIGLPAKFYGNIANRKELCKALGLGDSYTGLYKENLYLIDLAKKGKLPKVQ